MAKQIDVVFVLGAPGAGKGTQCSTSAEAFNDVAHFSAGDLLRAERNKGSEKGEMINHYIKEGLIVPAEVTIGLLKTAIESSPARIFLIDGFPRSIDQGRMFEELPCTFVLHLTAPEDVCTERILSRAAKSDAPRVDDNRASLQKRFKTHREVCFPVVEHYGAQGKVRDVDATRPPEEVREDVWALLKAEFGDLL